MPPSAYVWCAYSAPKKKSKAPSESVNSTTLSICSRRWQHRPSRSAAENRDVAKAGAIVIAVQEVARQGAAKKVPLEERIIRAGRCRAVARAGPSAARQHLRASAEAAAPDEDDQAADDQAVARADLVAAADPAEVLEKAA